jgi:heme A synthase
MAAAIRNIHEWLGYAVFVLVIVVAVLAWRDARRGSALEAGRASGTMILLDVHVTVGIVLYVLLRTWEQSANPLVAYLHPLLAIAALGVGHAALARARRASNGREANRTIARGFGLAVVLITAAIGVFRLGAVSAG